MRGVEEIYTDALQVVTLYDLPFLGSSAAAAGLGGTIVGQKVGKFLSPESAAIFSRIGERTIEIASALGSGALGAACGLTAGFWFIEKIKRSESYPS